MNRSKTWLRIRQSFWFLPALFGVLSFILVIGVTIVDFSFSKGQLQNVVPKFAITNSKLSITLLSTMLQSILTMMTISFSTIMVVLTTFSGQFSPRTLQNFVSDQKTQYVIAIFVSGVVYNLFTLLVMKPSNHGSLLMIPIISVLIGLLCVAAFVFFINHVSKWVQVNHLIDKLTEEAVETIKRVYKETEEFQIEDGHEDDSLHTEGKEHIIVGKNAGYVGLIDLNHLIRQAKKDDVSIRFQVNIGDYVMDGTPLFIYWKSDQDKEVDESNYRRSLKLRVERTGVQDIEFGIQKLVEIALRAISPGINDPHTAINCINRIGTILNEVSQNHEVRRYLYDSEGVPRVEMKHSDFSHFLYKGFYQIRHYGKEDVSVTIAILHVLKLLAETVHSSFRKNVFEFADYIYAGFDQNVLVGRDKAYIQQELNKLKELAQET